MIEQEYGKYIGICDVCGEVTPIFDTWTDCRDYMRKHWKTRKDEKTGEWENICPECQSKDLKNDFN